MLRVIISSCIFPAYKDLFLSISKTKQIPYILETGRKDGEVPWPATVMEKMYEVERKLLVKFDRQLPFLSSTESDQNNTIYVSLSDYPFTKMERGNN